MCGIAGFFGIPDRSVPTRLLLQRMISAISHRGPDAQGFYVNDEIGLGHARLSIIDIAAGHQPMANAAGDVFVTFNGEIFNYIELRDELIAKGHHFATRSDTEVILEAYRAYGEQCVQHFNGQWSFGIWDAAERKLFLTRDRLGVRPMFYTQT